MFIIRYEYDEGKYSCFKCYIITQSLLFSYIQHLKIPHLVSSPIVPLII